MSPSDHGTPRFLLVTPRLMAASQVPTTAATPATAQSTRRFRQPRVLGPPSTGRSKSRSTCPGVRSPVPVRVSGSGESPLTTDSVPLPARMGRTLTRPNPASTAARSNSGIANCDPGWRQPGGLADPYGGPRCSTGNLVIIFPARFGGLRFARKGGTEIGSLPGRDVTVQTVAVVVPAYRAGRSLAKTLHELASFHQWRIADGLEVELAEVVVVFDRPVVALSPAEFVDVSAIDGRIRAVWLSRNFGQHPATVAGIASTNSDWIVTMDEDGQHDPSHIPEMIRQAVMAASSLVYAQPSEAAPHGYLRNAASMAAKFLFRVLTGHRAFFHSYRVMEGPVARSVSAFAGPDVYLDVALAWALDNPTNVSIPMRSETATHSSYSLRKLLSHFWRMVLSSGTRPLRLIAGVGSLVAAFGVMLAVYVVISALGKAPAVPGWASVMVAVLIVGGALLIAIAILAEYVGYAVRMAMGKPLFVVTEDPDGRVLFRARAAIRVGSDECVNS